MEGTERVLNDPAFANELRRRGPVRAREFSWEQSVAKTHGLYEAVANRRQKRTA